MNHLESESGSNLGDFIYLLRIESINCSIDRNLRSMAMAVETMVTTVDKGNSSENAAISKSVRKLELKDDEFVVENYSVRKGMGVGKRIRSEEIVVGGHRWVVDLYPQGKNEDAHNAGYVSVYISRTSETVEPVQMLHAIHFLDQSGKFDDYGISTLVSKQVEFMGGRSIGYSRFVSQAALDSPDFPYLKHDALKIAFSVGVFSYHDVRNHSYSTSSTVDLKQLLKLQWMDEFVYFRVENETYCAAKSIIVARCPTLLNEHQLEEEEEDNLAAIPISDIDPYIFKVALFFLFFDSLHKLDQEAVVDSDPLNHESFAAKLLAAAHRFEIKGLKRVCESTLSKKVSRDSVVSLLQLAHLCNAAELKSVCLKFAAPNRLVIMESDECEVLKETCPLLFLELAGLGDNCSIPSKNKGLLDTAVSTVRESLIGVRESLVANFFFF